MTRYEWERELDNYANEPEEETLPCAGYTPEENAAVRAKLNGARMINTTVSYSLDVQVKHTSEGANPHPTAQDIAYVLGTALKLMYPRVAGFEVVLNGIRGPESVDENLHVQTQQ